MTNDFDKTGNSGIDQIIIVEDISPSNSRKSLTTKSEANEVNFDANLKVKWTGFYRKPVEP